MHGLGNDFVVIDAINQPFCPSEAQVRAMARPHFGIGFDQLLLVEPSREDGVDFRYRIFNADGSEVAQCGNGARCFARFVRDKGLTEKDEILVETASGLIILYLEADGQVRVNMGRARFTPAEIPFAAPEAQPLYTIEAPQLAGGELTFGAVSMGNPHAVIQVESTALAPVEGVGPWLERHPLFPERVNVGFMQVLDRGHIRLRVFERGSGETLACGTGACAAMVVGRLNELLDEEVVVSLPGGDLTIRWAGGDQPVWMVGPAVTVFEGSITL